MPPPASKKAAMTARHSARSSGSSPTLKVIQLPIPTAGTGSSGRRNALREFFTGRGCERRCQERGARAGQHGPTGHTHGTPLSSGRRPDHGVTPPSVQRRIGECGGSPRFPVSEVGATRKWVLSMNVLPNAAGVGISATLASTSGLRKPSAQTGSVPDDGQT